MFKLLSSSVKNEKYKLLAITLPIDSKSPVTFLPTTSLYITLFLLEEPTIKFWTLNASLNKEGVIPNKTIDITHLIIICEKPVFLSVNLSGLINDWIKEKVSLKIINSPKIIPTFW